MFHVAEYYIDKALRALKYDVDNDPDLMNSEEGSGTAGRIAKIWGGNLSGNSNEELTNGRVQKFPKLAFFTKF
jgi:hypothetical protein